MLLVKRVGKFFILLNRFLKKYILCGLFERKKPQKIDFEKIT